MISEIVWLAVDRMRAKKKISKIKVSNCKIDSLDYVSNG